MAASPRFNFSPIYSLSLARQLSRVTGASAARSHLRRVPVSTSPATLFPEPSKSARALWDYSVLDRLQSPLTRFHE